MTETVLLTLVNASNTQILSSKQDPSSTCTGVGSSNLFCLPRLGSVRDVTYRHGLSWSSLSKTLGKNHSCNAPPPPYAQQTLN